MQTNNSHFENRISFFKKMIQKINFKNRTNNIMNSQEMNNLDADEQILEHLKEFRNVKVFEIMIPRTEILGSQSNVSLLELKKDFINTKLTRIPIYNDNLDDLIGFVHVKDFFAYINNEEKKFELKDLIRPVLYVPRFTKCIDLLMEMKKTALHVAVILDEYGGTEGIITITHLIEGILGDINDEHDVYDQRKHFIQKIQENIYIIDGRIHIQDLMKSLSEKYDLQFLEEGEGEYETLSGFILSYIGKMPSKGYVMEHPSGVSFKIIHTSTRRIHKVQVCFAG